LFDARFHRGRCPDYFYQLDNECVYLATNGKIYSWNQVQHVCSRQVARLLSKQTSFAIGQEMIRPMNGVRQFILNTPEKTKLLEALYRDYDELNYAVRLLSDYETLNRCDDEHEDHWPSYCFSPHVSNGTCFEASDIGSNHVCIRQVDCDKTELRLACEFTLPGLLCI
jgi:hypothetical protein